MKKRISRLLKEERGNVLVLVAVLLTVLFGITALVIDGGRLYLAKSMLQKAADAGALAGAQELIFDDINFTESKSIATTIANKNYFGVENVTETNNIVENVFPNEKEIKVITSKNVELTFGKIFAIPSVEVNASATVKLFPLSSSKGIIPLGINKNSNLKPGETFTLKLYSPSVKSDLGPGNTGALVLVDPNYDKKGKKDEPDSPSEDNNKLCKKNGNPDTGANSFNHDLCYGSKFEIKIGQLLPLEPGNMVGPTVDAISYRMSSCSEYSYSSTNPPPVDCKRVVIVPVYSIPEPFKDKVEVVGFATFLLTKIEEVEEEDVKGAKNKRAEVTGIFMEFSAAGNSDPKSPEDYYTYGYKLVE